MSMRPEDLRVEVDRAIASGTVPVALSRLAELWHAGAGAATADFVISRYGRLHDRVPLIPHRLGILRSYTVEPVIPPLRASAFIGGIDLAVHVGEFNAYPTEILNPQSVLYAFEPDTVILATQTVDVAPELWLESARLTAEQRRAAVERVGHHFRDLVEAFRRRSSAHLILHLLNSPAVPTQGLLDGQLEDGQGEAIHDINHGLRRLAREHRGVYTLDYDALVARHGRDAWTDDRKWWTVRLPVAAPHLIHLANEWVRFLHPITGRIAKVLAVDLDNTLWGGIVGEDGVAGIAVGPEYPGAAYQALQRALLDLYQRGILLAICSKNNVEDAMEALETHPGMLLRPRHFTACRINWNDKADNLREIAAELNVGLDALAFLDDNPVERQHVRETLPEVMVLELPADPVAYPRVIRDYPAFERLTLSDEDRMRPQYYAADRDRAQLERSCSTPEGFYRSLQQEIEIAPVTSMTLSRVAQLTQKTNQWNLTTRRYTEQQLLALAERPAWSVLSLRVRDRYADNGLVGVAILEDRGDVCEIHALLLSCRVIGRTVETALLASMSEAARTRGVKRLQGWFLPTKKNGLAKDFYASHNFVRVSENERGTLWEIDLTRQTVALPEWIRVTVPEEVQL